MNRRQILLHACGALGAARGVASPAPAMPASDPSGRQTARAVALPGDALPMRHWLYLPPRYEAEPARAWPLVVFLHGSGERGLDLDRVKAHGPPRLLDASPVLPAIVVSPQLEEGQSWDPGRLHALLGVLRAQWRIDVARVSCTGLSLGGMGTWDWATAHPQDLAAIAPVCGGGDPALVCRIGAMPVWAFHGAADDVVPLAGQQRCIDALRACGRAPRFTVYPGVGHDSWNPAYADPALMPWLLAQRRRG